MRALLVGLLAFVLVTQAAAAAVQGTAARAHGNAAKAKSVRPPETLDERLQVKVAAARKFRGTIRFFENHRYLLGSTPHRSTAAQALDRAERRLEQLTGTIAWLRRAIRERDHRRDAKLSPRAVICDVFGPDCDSAADVAWCESGWRTTAQNGQYLGMFQMGSHERSLFGHGPTAREQAVAARKYFVLSGRDWSPWSCRYAIS